MKNSKIQHHLMEIIHDVNHHHINSHWLPVDINRINACGNEGAVAFTTLPILNEHRITTGFDMLLCHRLGIDYSCLPSGLCFCGEVLTQNHSLNCHHKNLRQTTHNSLLYKLVNLCTAAGLPARTEVLTGNGKHRMDMVTYINGKEVWSDISIINPNQQKYNNHVVEASTPTTEREKEKTVKYLVEATAANAEFYPFVLGLFGAMGQKTREFFNKLTLKVMSTGNGSTRFASLSTVRRYYRANLVIAMHRTIAHSFLKRISDLISTRQHNSIGQSQDNFQLFPLDNSAYSNNNPLLVDDAFRY
jgi:hypothetical protein